MDPQKPVPSRSALSRERKRRRGSALSHMRKGNPHGGWKSSSLSRLPLWPLCPLRGRPSHRRRRDFLFPEGIPPLASFRVPGSQFRVGWEDSRSPARSLTLGQRGVPLPPREQPGGPWVTDTLRWAPSVWLPPPKGHCLGKTVRKTPLARCGEHPGCEAAAPRLPPGPRGRSSGRSPWVFRAGVNSAGGRAVGAGELGGTRGFCGGMDARVRAGARRHGRHGGVQLQPTSPPPRVPADTRVTRTRTGARDRPVTRATPLTAPRRSLLGFQN